MKHVPINEVSVSVSFPHVTFSHKSIILSGIISSFISHQSSRHDLHNPSSLTVLFIDSHS